jgi:dephospho-CoA kinase
MSKIVAIVGMPGSGKTEVVKIFEQHGWQRIWFGQLTLDELAARGLPINEANERTVREQLRSQHGMDAYAKLNLPKIRQALQRGNVVIDGLYSFEEYLFLKELYKQLFVIAVHASPAIRYRRLVSRAVRGLTLEECFSRDRAQLENLHTGGPIAMADHVIVNEGSLDELRNAVESILQKLEN